jgi:type IV secretory pathway VirB10-like protein
MKALKLLFLYGLTLARSAWAEKFKNLKKPFKARLEKPLPYEITEGTFISLVLLTAANTPIVVAQVTTDIFDRYENVALPKGSRLLGKYIKQLDARHQILWTDLQAPSIGRILALEPPLNATTSDGSSGVVNFQPGALAGATVGKSFIVPH